MSMAFQVFFAMTLNRSIGPTVVEMDHDYNRLSQFLVEFLTIMTSIHLARRSTDGCIHVGRVV